VSARSISSRSPWRRRLTPRISAASWAFTDCLGAPRPAGRQRAGLDTTRWFRIKQGAKRVMPEAVIPQIDRGLVGAPRRCSLQNQFNYPTAERRTPASGGVKSCFARVRRAIKQSETQRHRAHKQPLVIDTRCDTGTVKREAEEGWGGDRHLTAQSSSGSRWCSRRRRL
jgi:hypothetical protein